MKNNAMKDNVIKARGKNYSEKTIKIVVNLATRSAKRLEPMTQHEFFNLPN